MRLIDADSIKYHRTTECGGHGVFLDVDMVYKEEIDAISTIDPESLRPRGTWEGRHGRWLTTDAYPHHLYCSVCYKTYAKNAKWVNELDLPTNYCPNCGAKMEVGY